MAPAYLSYLELDNRETMILERDVRIAFAVIFVIKGGEERRATSCSQRIRNEQKKAGEIHGAIIHKEGITII